MSKKDKYPIAVVFSDLHINDYNTHNKDNKRTNAHFQVLEDIKAISNKYNIPAIFCGDLFQKPEYMSNVLFEQVVERFKELDDNSWDLYCISGNHDMSKRNTINETQSPSWVKSLSQIFNFLHCVDFKTFSIDDVLNSHIINVTGVPYIDHNKDLAEYLEGIKIKKGTKHILLLHSDYPGAKDTDGYSVGSSENINYEMLSRFDLVLMGHIHKPQKLHKGIYMVGAPLQQRRTDRDCSMGYGIIYSDLSFKFKPWDRYYPRFVEVSSKDEIQDDDNYYIVIPEIQEPQQEEEVSNEVNISLSSKKLVRKYLKAIGVKDRSKKKILVNLIKEARK